MNTSPSGSQYGIWHTPTDNTINSFSNMNSFSSIANTNFAKVMGSFNTTVQAGASEESAQIQAWLSPLEPNARHRDVSSQQVAGVGSWVLQKNEFDSWRKSQDNSVNRTLLCYGDQGVGKTYIRYKSIFQRQ